jgi:hypothetical protein
MLPILVVKRKMSIIKQFGKGDNAHQRSLASRSSLKKQFKKRYQSIFIINLHHDSIKV